MRVPLFRSKHRDADDEWIGTPTAKSSALTDAEIARNGKRNAGTAHVPRVDAGVTVPALADDPAYVERYARLVELQFELQALEAEISVHHRKLEAAAASERAATMAAAAKLTSAPESAALKEYTSREAVLRTLEELNERRKLVHAALGMQRRLVDEARNAASAAGLERARPHHQVLVGRVLEAALALSRACEAEEDFRAALEANGLYSSQLMACVPGFHGATGRLSYEFSPIRRFLRDLQLAGYPVLRVPEAPETLTPPGGRGGSNL